jgi:hypothetical protein
MSISIFTLLISLSFNSVVHAQNSAGPAQKGDFWLNAGIWTGISYPYWPNAALSLSYQKGPNLLSARVTESAELFGDGVYDVGILYGRCLKEKMGFVSMAGGISYVFFYSSGNGGNLNPVGIGIPIELQLFTTPLSFAGIGIYGYANLNLKHPSVGALICLELGKLR